MVVGIGTGFSIILTPFAHGGVDLGLFPGSMHPSVVAGLAADWVDVGLGG